MRPTKSIDRANLTAEIKSLFRGGAVHMLGVTLKGAKSVGTSGKPTAAKPPRAGQSQPTRVRSHATDFSHLHATTASAHSAPGSLWSAVASCLADAVPKSAAPKAAARSWDAAHARLTGPSNRPR